MFLIRFPVLLFSAATLTLSIYGLEHQSFDHVHLQKQKLESRTLPDVNSLRGFFSLTERRFMQQLSESGMSTGNVQENGAKYEDLETVARRVARDKTVFLVSVNKAYTDMFHNWMLFMRRLGYDEHILVAAEDLGAYEIAQKLLPGQVVIYITPEMGNKTAATRPDGYAYFGSEEFYDIVLRRPMYIEALLELGYDVIYSDTDLLWLKDPFPYFQGDFDIILNVDAKDDFALSINSIAPLDNTSKDLCTCLLVCHPNPHTLEIVKRWIGNMVEEGRRHNGDSDQGRFNDVIREAIDKDRLDVRIGILPQQKFANGWEYFDEDWPKESREKAVVAHRNFIAGKENKINSLRNYGLWLLDDNDSNQGQASNLQSSTAMSPPLFTTVESDESRDEHFLRLEKLARYAEKDGRVIVGIVGPDERELFTNWVASLSQLKLSAHFLVLADDSEILAFIEKDWPGHGLVMDFPDISRMLQRRAGSSSDLSSIPAKLEEILHFGRKPFLLKHLLELGLEVAYCDVGSTWLQSPFEFFNGSFDILLMEEAHQGKVMDVLDNQITFDETKIGQVSPQVMVLKPTQSAKKLLQEWALQVLTCGLTFRVTEKSLLNHALSRLHRRRRLEGVGIIHSL